ncbi:MAG: DUF3168 domain-containing protein [Allosphingosinicella sp.]|uniref:tail completion protein gp17 n=1 Tax=Allosphingosinicella sp. TaxID=2823234 RepID=UPI0039595F28
MSGAGARLQQAAMAALGAVPGLSGVHEEAPVQAAFPYAVVETGSEADWGHKSGAGREVRLAAVLRDAGERAARLRELGAAAEAAIAGIGPELAEWRLAGLVFLRSRLVRDGRGWALTVEFRARMLGV